MESTPLFFRLTNAEKPLLHKIRRLQPKTASSDVIHKALRLGLEAYLDWVQGKKLTRQSQAWEKYATTLEGSTLAAAHTLFSNLQVEDAEEG